jgi:hypothetical protein
MALLICLPATAAEGAPAPLVFKPEMEVELLGAISAMKEFIHRDKEPDTKEVSPQKKIIDKHAAIFGHDKKIIKAAMDLVTTYDKTKGPLFVARDGWDKGRKSANPPPDSIHTTIYNVMQHIFDHVYTLENIKKHDDLIEGFDFGSHEFFPGPVGEPSRKTYKVKIDARSPKYVTFENLGGPRRPTGAYVAPGTIVTIKVPKSLVNNGYKLRVGAHSWDNTRKRRVTRLARVSHVYDITSSKIKVGHPLGGAIYVEVPVGANDGIVTLSIKNAVRSPYFSATSFQKTTNKEWAEVESKRNAPWADFHTDKFMMQVPTMWVTNMTDPEKLMADWDLACDAQNELFGQPRTKSRHTHYMQVDLQNRGNAFYPGYPTCNDRYNPNKETNYMGYAKHHLVRGPQYAHSYVFHEQGHAFFCPKYPGERESVVNLPHVAVWNKKFGYSLDHAFSASRSHPDDTRHTIDNSAIAWMSCLHFASNSPMLNYEKQYQWKGHAKYADIVRLFGWDVLSKYWSAFNEDVKNETYKGRHAYSNDEITLRKCKAIGVDIRPLMRFWGIHEDDSEALAKQVKEGKFPPSAKIYDTLVRYKSLVPKDNAAFREFAQIWWDKEPSIKGFTEERNHAGYWASYDEKVAEQLQNVVQELIEKYFPNGRP